MEFCRHERNLRKYCAYCKCVSVIKRF
jgi:hypothetical protein